MVLDIDVDISFCLYEPVEADQLRDFLRAVEDHADPVAYEVIAAGGDFRADSPEGRALLAEFPQLTFYENPPPTPGGRLNQAMGLAAGRYLAPWSALVHPLPGCLVNLVEFLDENPETAAAGPRLLDEKNRLLPSRRRLPGLTVLLLLHTVLGASGLGGPLLRRYYGADLPRVLRYDSAEFLLARALLLRREALEEVGGFDEGFRRLYFDADWCRRVRKPGWYCHFLAGAPARDLQPELYYPRYLRDNPAPGQLADATRLLLKGLL